MPLEVVLYTYIENHYLNVYDVKICKFLDLFQCAISINSVKYSNILYIINESNDDSDLSQAAYSYL